VANTLFELVHPHCVFLHLAYWWLVTLLYRPAYLQATSHSSSEVNSRIMVCSYALIFYMADHIFQLCDEAAKNIMTLLGSWNSLFGLRYVPLTLVQVAFSAATVLLLSIEHGTTRRPTSFSLYDSRTQLDLCVEYLSEVGKSFSTARQVKGILRELRQTQSNRLHGCPSESGQTHSSLSVPLLPPSGLPPTHNTSSFLNNDNFGYFPPLSRLQDQQAALPPDIYMNFPNF
jgi:hypothetical protein